jgi:hypothetical protein
MTHPIPDGTVGEIRSLSQTTRELNTTAKDLSKKFDIGKNALRRIRGLTIVVVLLILVMSAGALASGIVIYRQGQRIEQFSARIDDCLNPGGQCYETQQQNTRGFIVEITDANHNGKADAAEILDALQKILERR